MSVGIRRRQASIPSRAASNPSPQTSERPFGAAVAVLVPCHNEEGAIQTVVRDFRAALPAATIYVYDNNSSDRTSDMAMAAGAIVRREPLQGKGNVVRRMFADIEADVYVLVDGDDTYHAGSAVMLEAIAEGIARVQLQDMVNAAA